MPMPPDTRRSRQAGCRVRPGATWRRHFGVLLTAWGWTVILWASTPPPPTDGEPSSTNAPTETAPALTAPTNAPPPAAEPEVSTSGRIDSAYARISARVGRFAKNVDNELCAWITPDDQRTSGTLDRFFGSRADAGEDAGRSCLRIAPGVSVSRESGVKPLTRFGLTLMVPQFTDRLQFVANNFQQDEDVLPDITDFFNEHRQVAREDDESAGLRLNLLDTAGYGLSAGAGIRFRPAPVPSFKLKGGIGRQAGPWEYRAEETGFWQSDEGFGEKTALIHTYHYSDRLTLGSEEAVLWQEVQTGLTVGVTLSLRYALHGDRSIGLSGAVQGSTRPTVEVDHYALRVPCQRRLYRDWLHLQIEPGLNFDRDHNFTVDPIVTVALEFRFGYVPKPKLD